MSFAQNLVAGFENPSLDSQSTFRQIMDAWARPGQVARIDEITDAPLGLDIAGAAFALTLVDQDTQVWLSADTGACKDWLRFHCGCPITEQANDAAFAFAQAAELQDLQLFNTGDAVVPDRGATLVLRVDAIGQGQALRLEGPGIQNNISVKVSGVNNNVWDARASLAPLFPAGLDLVLTSQRNLICIPRTTKITLED